MADYDNELRGALFKNENKESDKHPDYKGQCQIDGVEYWIASWIKEGKKGKFMSISFEAKDKNKPAKRKQAEDDDADSIPF